MVKIYDPAGRVAVREVIPDDGIAAPSYVPPIAGWDHEAWYYACCYSRGLEPAVRWSTWSDPARLAAMPQRTFAYKVAAGPAGVYRIALLGLPDHYVDLRLTPDLPYGVVSNVTWLHGHGDQYRKSWLYVPQQAKKAYVLFLQNDQPAQRTFILRDPQGQALELHDTADGASKEPTPQGVVYPGVVQREVFFPGIGHYDGQLLALEVSAGPGDFLVGVAFGLHADPAWKRPNNTVNALFAPDPETAMALRGGTILHDGKQFWHAYQVRYHDWLKTLNPEDAALPAGLPQAPDYHSPGSHQRPAANSADRIMHSYGVHKNAQALHAALVEMNTGLNYIGPGDTILHGPTKNLAYEMGCYSFFYHRPAWRILQETQAPEAAKGPIREFILQVGDRLAFCRTGELVNGNALSSLVQALRYCYAASGDPLQKELFETYWDRFTNGGFGARVGVGPSGGIQESFGYDQNYGSYVLRGWAAVLTDLHDERFQAVHDRVSTLYSYVYDGKLETSPWSSRTHGGIAGGTYDPAKEPFAWKGNGGPDFTVGVNGHNEFFAARRAGYYAVTYHGRLTPTWEGEAFQGQIGFGGGMLCQLHVPGKGPVIASTLNGSYGQGMHLSQWRNFHLHTLVGTTADGLPMVSANSEHFDARLEGETVTSSGEVRQSSVRVLRRFTFEANAVVCEVRLAGAAADEVYNLYGGRPPLRGVLTELFEMIPFGNVPAKKRQGKNPPPLTRVLALDAEGRPAGAVTPESVQAPGIEIDRYGYGCRVIFAQPMTVILGKNDTLLVKLVDKPTPAREVRFAYRLEPYTGPSAADADPKGGTP